MVDYTLLDAFLTPACGANGVSTGVCEVSSSTLANPFDIYAFGAMLLDEAFIDNCSCPEFPIIDVRLDCLENEVVILKDAINSIIDQLDVGLPVSLTLDQALTLSGNTTGLGMGDVEFPLCPVA